MRCSRLARLLVAVLILTTVLGSSGIALGQRITAANNDLSITVYNQGLGLVKEIRRIHVDSGITNVTVSDVAAQLDPTSVHFRSLSNASTQVLEQNFEYDLVNQSRLLERYLGQEIELIDDNNTSRRVTLLAHQGGNLVVMEGDRIVIDPPGRIRLPRLPDGLIIRPTLMWLVSSQTAGPQLVELTYLTRGISWYADYVGVLTPSGELALSGWVTLENNSGKSYENANLQLVAGDINLVSDSQVRPENLLVQRAQAPYTAQPQFVEENLFEYHLYTLDRRTTIKDRQIKQIGLLSCDSAETDTVYLLENNVWYNGSSPIKVMLQRTPQRSRIPLPQGKSPVSNRQLGSCGLSEKTASAYAQGRGLRLHVGNAFDVRRSTA